MSPEAPKTIQSDPHLAEAERRMRAEAVLAAAKAAKANDRLITVSGDE
jgi:hypothetical protein